MWHVAPLLALSARPLAPADTCTDSTLADRGDSSPSAETLQLVDWCQQSEAESFLAIYPSTPSIFVLTPPRKHELWLFCECGVGDVTFSITIVIKQRDDLSSDVKKKFGETWDGNTKDQQKKFLQPHHKESLMYQTFLHFSHRLCRFGAVLLVWKCSPGKQPGAKKTFSIKQSL